MRFPTAILGALALAVWTAPASAAQLAVFTHDYGQGQYNPRGNDPLGPDYVEISEASSRPFRDRFDFRNQIAAGATIDSIELTLDFADAGPSFFFGLFPLETWQVRVTGSNNGSQADDFVADLVDADAPMTFVLDASTDTGGVDAFARAVQRERLTFQFQEPGFINFDTFRLFSATLTINGTPAVVPVPVPGLMLLAGLGGLSLAARRRRRGAAQA